QQGQLQMSDTGLKDSITSTIEGRFVWEQERSILEIMELVCEIMEAEGVSRAELARRLGRTKGYISQLLDGSANMQVRTISDLFTALGYAFHPDCSRLDGSP